ncbi:protein ERGIC-53 [Folsomia candida]|uniref:protein ERGIC-53 n=1 Tax=Folsomia candida TaxID=158441 RepID=UPI000B904AAB|nr:protein ERGIC-53 [Folsomia candida]XP_035706906.1 protein ERGIC-53 [Folsomia candida]
MDPSPIVITFAAFFLLATVSGQEPFRRFEYKYSFKPPYLSQKDGTVPFWEHSGNAIASEENLRITPSLKSQKGMIWSKLPTAFEWWEVEILFRVTGRGRIGADGLAFWFTEQKGVEGPVFGTSDKWVGLGVLFDTFDNDNKHNNPYIMAMVNDGTKAYDHQNDGSTQQLAGCLRDFRNKPFPVRTKVMYYKNVLSIFINNGMSNSDTDYELCLRAENVFLPSRGYFGLSAATGGLADDHDVQKFMTWSLLLDSATYGDVTAEQQKFDQEFKQYQDQLDKKKEEYHKEHPDAKKEKDDDDWFEEEQIRELRQIFQGQSELRGLVQTLSRKLDEIVGRQETTISLVSSFQGQGAIGHIPQGQIPMQPPAVGGGGMARHEVDNMLAASRELLTSTRDIKTLLQTMSANNGGKPASYGNIDITGSVNELKDGINTLKRDVSAVSQRVHSAPVGTGASGQMGGCPSCVSTTVVVAMGFVQMGVILGYLLYKSSKENQAKKFY